MKTKIELTFWVVIAVLLVNSCRSYEAGREVMLSNMAAAEIPPSPNAGNDKISISVERKIIKQGEIRFETRNAEETESLVVRSVTGLRGYISNDNVFNDNERITHRMTIRVPAENFDTLLSEITRRAGKLENKNIEARDVTEEYIDIQSRIKTKKELEHRYRELLVKATTVGEILSIEKEMGTLRTEIESIEGRLQFLSDQVNQSTLTVEFYQLTASSFSFTSKSGQALITGWKWLLAFIIGVIHFWPFLLIMVIVLLIVFRIAKRRKAKV
jgi:hypothetical protein